MQHDCQEFLALLLNSLHEELNLKKRGGTAYDNSRGDGRYHNQGDIGAASGHNGATNSNTAALVEEELDEDELRKIEHKNQDEQPTSMVTSSVLVDSADMENDSTTDGFAPKLCRSSFHAQHDASQRKCFSKYFQKWLHIGVLLVTSVVYAWGGGGGSRTVSWLPI